MKKRWFGERKYQRERREEKEIAKADIRWLADRGDEEGFIAYQKALRPAISEEELQEALRLFREYVASRGRQP